jgi:hypothetical protein
MWCWRRVEDALVMFYNGATPRCALADRLVVFDAEYSKVVDRCVEP